MISKEFVDYEIDKLERYIKSGKKVDHTSFIIVLADLQMASPNYEINKESVQFKRIKQLMGRQR